MSPMRKVARQYLIILILLCLFGCSMTGTDPVSPEKIETDSPKTVMIPGEGKLSAERFPIGFFSCEADPIAGALLIVPLRSVSQHFNIVIYLEGENQLITQESSPQFSDGGNTLDLDIGITHPMSNTYYTGFDFRMIIVSEGSISGWNNPSVKLAGLNETRLVNADGFTRWWNPGEFSGSGLWGYNPGNYGNSVNPSQAATLNGYKYFAAGLGANDDISELNLGNRGVTFAETKNVRHMTISLLGGYSFNYAVDACWASPVHNPPQTLSDFPPDANQKEAYRVDVAELVNTLWYVNGSQNGGNLSLRVTAYDWQNASSIGWARVEIPSLNIDQNMGLKSTGNKEKEFSLDLTDVQVPGSGPLPVLVTVQCPGADYQPSKTNVSGELAAYQFVALDVSPSDPGSNQPPTACASILENPPYYAGTEYTLDANCSDDPDGNIVELSWDVDYDGSNFTPDGYGWTLSNTFGIGETDIQLMVMDDAGNIASPATPMHINFLDPNNDPPTWDSSVGVTSVETGDNLATVYYGTASDPDQPVTYNVYWSQTSPIDFDNASKLIGESGSPTDVYPLTNGITYYFAVRAQDSTGLEDSNSIELSGYPHNEAPEWDSTTGITSATGGNSQVTVNFGTASDPDTPVTYSIYYSITSPINFGSASKITGVSGSPYTVQGLINGLEYHFAVRAVDGHGLMEYNNVELPATPAGTNQPPVINSVQLSRTTTLKASYAERVTLTVNASDPDPGDSLTYNWSSDYGTFLTNGTSQVEWVSPNGVGHVYITIKVTDESGEWVEDSSKFIRVTQYPTGNKPPGYNVSEPAPMWTVERFPDHQQVSLSDVSPGNVVYLNFWHDT